MTSISITRALVELKTIDARINKLTRALNPVTTGLVKPQSTSVREEQEQFNAAALAQWQSVQDLIARRDKIKRGIIMSNATTQVEIQGQTLSVAEAIDKKNSISLKQNLLQHLRAERSGAVNERERDKTRLQERLDAFIQSQERVLKDPEMLKTSVAAFKEMHETRILDPLNLDEIISALDAEIDGFISEVDFVLSESNARTTIEV